MRGLSVFSDHLQEEERGGEQKHLSQGQVDAENIGQTSAKECFWASGIISQDFHHV